MVVNICDNDDGDDVLPNHLCWTNGLSEDTLELFFLTRSIKMASKGRWYAPNNYNSE